MMSFVHNNEIIIQPCSLPQSWTNPISQESYSGLHNLSLEELDIIGWKIVEDNPPTYNSFLENLSSSDWYFDIINNYVIRDYTINLNTFEISLNNCFGELDKNREKYETQGFVYDYYGTNVYILTDKESSQGKLSASRLSVIDGTRTDNDVWKFERFPNRETIVVQLSNNDLLIICGFVFRQIQDAYNLTSYIAWQMLGCGNTETLKQAIESETLSLNPWRKNVF